MTGGGLDDARRARVWLARTVEPGSAAVIEYVERLGPQEAAHRIRCGAAPDAIRSLAAARSAEDRVDRDLEIAHRHGIRTLFPEDPDWPAYPLLPMDVATARGVPDLAAPLMLWLRGAGRTVELTERAVAVVGSRAATAYGTHVATDLAYHLSEQGWSVVSGGAYGIDAAAHRGALSGSTPTIAVIAGGLDLPYPAGNRRLFDRLADTGLLVSEWPPGCAPQRHRFLVRNRLIAGLTAGTVVVEAGRRSGAKQTARRARELGRPVMVVPGPVTSAMSVGSHDLARDGARLVTCAADVLAEVGPLGAGLDGCRDPSAGVPLDTLDDTTRQVLDGVPVRRAAPVERIARAAGVPARTVLRSLPVLEAAGFVESTNGEWRLAPQPRASGGAVLPTHPQGG
ncbi:MAG: DNA-protecting protein DprA [Actinobacteria bacterium]|nr:DNA-protecting protein DprA [Actinomycetota bacterium]